MSGTLQRHNTTKFWKVILLVWKNYLMQKKQPIHTLMEILLPLAVSYLLVWLRFHVNTQDVPTPIKYPSFSLEDCFGTSLIKSRAWSIAWSPNTSPFASAVMEKFNLNQPKTNESHCNVIRGRPKIPYLHSKYLMNTIVSKYREKIPYVTPTVAIQYHDVISDRLKNGWAQTGAVESFTNDIEMQRTFTYANNTKAFLAAISFDESVEDINLQEMIIPQNLQVRIRFPALSRYIDNQSTTFDTNFPNWKTFVAFPIYQPFGPRDVFSIFGGQPGYCKEGFIPVQWAVFESIFNIYNAKFRPNNTIKIPEIQFQRFPYPSFVLDKLLPALISYISIFIIFSYTYSAVRTIKLITVEKETQMKEIMKLMGLNSWMHWTAWLIKEFIQWFILSILITIALTLEWKNGCVFKKTNPTIILFILMLYSFTSICFCFLMTSFFNKSNYVATVGAAMWFLSYSPYLIYQPSYENMSWLQIVSWCFLSNTNIGYIFQMIVMYEGKGMGIQWRNFFTPVSPTDKVSPAELTIYLFIDAVLYLSVAIYMEEVWPGAYGIPRPWYYPFQISYWRGHNRTLHDGRASKGIQIKDLTKIYQNKNRFKAKIAVNRLTLDVYPNQITTLLGHNGAGKSSAMSMLIGLTCPTSGTAKINEYDIWSEMEKIRESLGLCPQFDPLFEELTIKEHLSFFGKLKGCYGENLKNEINKYVTKLEMESRLHCKAGGLSGGFKRKLSVAIALVGHSEVVLLDEPSSGMDPTAKRCLWDLLQEEKNGRTIMMTTHSMDEADLLSDRVAILSNGQLKCVDTPFVLKKQYGCGYTLSLVKMTPDLNLDDITSFLKAHNNCTEIVSNTETEVKFKLGYSVAMSQLLDELTEKQQDLAIKEYGISLTTLEDVYMSVIPTEDESDRLKNCEREGYNYPCSISDIIQDSQNDLPTCSKYVSKNTIDTSRVKWTTQFGTMIHKKYVVSKRGWQLHLIQLCTTFIFLLIATAVTEAWKSSVDMPPLNLTLRNYRNPVIIVGEDVRGYAYQMFESIKSVARQETSEVIPYKRNPNQIFVDNMIDAYKNPLEKIDERYIDKMLKNLAKGLKDDVFKLNKNMTKRERAEMIYKLYAADAFDNYLLDLYNDRLEAINERYIFGVELGNKFNNNSITVHFNNQPFHALPTALSTVQNAIVKTLSGEKYSLSFVNQPLPYVPEEKVKMMEHSSSFGFQIGFNIGFAHAFISASFILNIMKEQETGAKHLQFISGVKASAYWSASILWDSFMYMVSMIIILAYLYCQQDPAFSSNEQLVQVFALLTLYVWAIIPMVNLASYLFTKPSTAFMKTSMFGILTGCSVYLVVLMLEIRPLLLTDEANNIESAMIWVPHYSLCHGLKSIYQNHDQKSFYKNEGLQYPGDYAWNKPGIGKNLFVFLIIGLAFNVIILTLENVKHNLKKLCNITYKHCTCLGNRLDAKRELKRYNSQCDDADVMAEKMIVKNSLESDYIVILKNVTKKYKNLTVVNSLNLALRTHECFAFLGSNGAGKTTTFKMLTTKLDLTSGSISICSMDSVRKRSEVQKYIGYCPQQDALLEKLTCRETMKMFCTIRGIPKFEHYAVISQLSRRLMFREFLDVEVGNNSGGNRRKLSAAISMIGDPPILLLDEPTSGMDPKARKHLWNVIKEEREKGKCIIVTTHNLEECEALCTRLAIMVDGEIRCIGSAQHLKNKFASGYKLYVKFSPDKLQSVQDFISDTLTGSSIRENFDGMLLYYMPTEIQCSSVFSAMETAKQSDLIEDYSIQHISLEEVFMKVTRKVR